MGCRGAGDNYTHPSYFTFHTSPFILHPSYFTLHTSSFLPYSILSQKTAIFSENEKVFLRRYAGVINSKN
jgi:hypothetical protein